ncbi:MAG TPA: ABC transporter substrate-binding protein [Candidatus Binatia bacterium]|nr:ABC transporter substrate-binding protein [Candidatus Binatia bacterium]
MLLKEPAGCIRPRDAGTDLSHGLVFSPIRLQLDPLMKKALLVITLVFVCSAAWFSQSAAQDKKLEKIRIGGGGVGAPQMTMWFAKEANLYEKHGLAVEAIHIPGSSMALQAMLSGEMPIIQLGGTASMQANLAGADTVIVATILKKFLFSIFSRPEITQIADLKGKLFGATRFGTLSDFASRFALEKNGLNPERDITMVQTGGQPETVLALLTGKVQAAALSVPAILRAKRANMRELLDMAKLEATIHQNGVVTTRKYLKTNEDVVRRFLRAYIEGAVLAKRNKDFATRVMAKYLATNDREILDDAYERVTVHLEIPPYPTLEGVSVLLRSLEKTQPKAREAKPEDFIDARLVRELDKSGFIGQL